MNFILNTIEYYASSNNDDVKHSYFHKLFAIHIKKNILPSST